jgi:hypothetical protein
MPALPSPEESPFRLPQPGAGGGDGGCGHLPFNSPPPPKFFRLPLTSGERKNPFAHVDSLGRFTHILSTWAHLVAVFINEKNKRETWNFVLPAVNERTKEKRTKMSKAKFGINHWGCAVFFLVVVLLPDNLVCVGDRLVEEPAGETTHTL